MSLVVNLIYFSIFLLLISLCAFHIRRYLILESNQKLGEFSYLQWGVALVSALVLAGALGEINKMYNIYHFTKYTAAGCGVVIFLIILRKKKSEK